MQSIIVPTINSNDSDAILQAWCKADGERVSAGETIAVLETTKASFDLAAEADGVLSISAEIGQRYEYGASLGWIFSDSAEKERFVSERNPVERTGVFAEKPMITRAARELAAAHGISEERLTGLGKRIVRGFDVEELIGRGEGAPVAPVVATAMPVSGQGGEPLSAQQQSIARVVAHSRATIPEAFLLKKVQVDAALAEVARFSRQEKAMVSLPDLLVCLVSRLAPDFPAFYGALRDDLTFSESLAGNVGVTFDVGHGLFIPVVRNAGTLSLKEIAKVMMQFRMSATRNSFKSEALTGGDISLSLNMDADILCVIPVILKPQTCMLSVSAVLSELALDENGQPVSRRFIQLGVAYDHRAINGYHANAFANAIKARIETPDPAGWMAPGVQA